MARNQCVLSSEQFRSVRAEARRVLSEAGALGVIPTPVDEIVLASRIRDVCDVYIDDGFVSKIRQATKRIGGVLRRALDKVVGIFHASDGVVYLDRKILAVKRRFVLLHESGHAFIRWQRPMYAVVEDCEQTLDPAVAELFDVEANVFASEVLFQIDSFMEMAADKKFEIMTPVNLAKKFDASIYASIRQYVSKNQRSCAVLVLNMPEFIDGAGFRASMRRIVVSDNFDEMFDSKCWSAFYTPDDEIGALIPLGTRRASGRKHISLVDRNGCQHECVAEAFTNTYQVFVLICTVRALTAKTFLMQ